MNGERPIRRGVGIAGLGYVLGAAIENMAILESPLIGSPTAEIRSAYADQALVVVTSVAGALALLSYVAFAIGVFGLVRGSERRVERWALRLRIGPGLGCHAQRLACSPGVSRERGNLVAALHERAHERAAEHAGRAGDRDAHQLTVARSTVG